MLIYPLILTLVLLFVLTQPVQGMIMLNVDHLLSKYKSMRFDENGGDKDDWSLFKFLKEEI